MDTGFQQRSPEQELEHEVGPGAAYDHKVEQHQHTDPHQGHQQQGSIERFHVEERDDDESTKIIDDGQCAREGENAPGEVCPSSTSTPRAKAMSIAMRIPHPYSSPRTSVSVMPSLVMLANHPLQRPAPVNPDLSPGGVLGGGTHVATISVFTISCAPYKRRPGLVDRCSHADYLSLDTSSNSASTTSSPPADEPAPALAASLSVRPWA